MKRSLKPVLVLLLLTGCAGIERDCSSCGAQSFGGDWIVVQYRLDGTPLNCWQLHDTPITGEEHGDGIYWKEPTGHLVHLSGWIDRVQVDKGKYEEAAKVIGVELTRCKGGIYLPPSAGGALDAGG